MDKINRIHVTLTDAELQAIDDWSFSARVRTRTEAIRQLVKLGMERWREIESAKAEDGPPAGKGTGGV